MTNKQDGGKFKSKRKNAKQADDTKESSLDLCSQVNNDDEKTCSLTSDHTCGVSGITDTKSVKSRLAPYKNRDLS